MKRIIPYITAKKTNEALDIIKNNEFNIYEKSELGNNLLNVSLYHGEFEIAEELINLNKNEVFPLILNEDFSNLFLENLLINSNNIDFKKYLNFINKNNITINPNFLLLMSQISNEKINIDKLKDVEQFNLFKEFLKTTTNQIKKLNKFNAIKVISKCKNENLLKFYYDTCEFDKLPIKDHPSFKLLKNLTLNFKDYFDSYLFDEFGKQEYKNEIIQNELDIIEKNFNSINTEYDFEEYFKKDKDFYSSIFNIYKYFMNEGDEIPESEIKNIKKMLCNMNADIFEYGMENGEDFCQKFLINWPIYYFKEKKIANKIITENQEEKINELIEKFNIKKIVLEKDVNLEKMISLLSKSLDFLKSTFNLENKEIGNGDLTIFFSNKNTEKIGSYSINGSKELKIFAKNNEDENIFISTVIHEYTHYLQEYNKENKNINELENLHKKWIDYPIDLFSKRLYDYMCEFCVVEELNKNKDYLLFAIENNLKKNNNVILIFEKIKKDFNKFFKNEFEFDNFNNPKRRQILKKTIEKYLESQTKKDYSFEYYINQELDKKQNYKYWNEPNEIHARINQNLFVTEEKCVVLSFNPKKLTEMKNFIKGHNQMCIELLKEKKKSELKYKF